LIERETWKWTDDDNAIVKVAKTMATQIQLMTQYVRYEGPIKVCHIEDRTKNCRKYILLTIDLYQVKDKGVKMC